jgi:hypothetical protein
VTASGKGYLFRIKYTVGATSKYKMDSNAKSAGLNVKVGMVFTSKVLAYKNGVAKVQYVIEKPTMNGQPTGNRQSVVVENDSRGNLVGERTGDYQLGNIAYPKAPVPIGGSWTTNVETVSMGVNMKVKATYKLKGFKSFNGKRVAILNITMKNSGDYSSSGKGYSLVSVADGTPVSMKLYMKFKIGEQIVETDTLMKKL